MGRNFYRINYEDTSDVQEYNSLDVLLKETTQFYHDTFAGEENYDENKEFTNLQQALELWEGSGYCIAEELSTGVETSSYKFEVFTEKGTVVEVSSTIYDNIWELKGDDRIYSSYNIKFLLKDEDVELSDEERALLEDCAFILDNYIVNFIQFEEK